jgi:protein-tyrosine phosphatase
MNLKYGLLFAFLGVAMLTIACVQRGWAWIAIWPGVSFLFVGVAYLMAGTTIYGKRTNGVIPLHRFVLLAPFLTYTWLVWHIVRIFSREPVYHELSPKLLIGRRLLPHELPADVDCIVDLTSEFNEPPAIRRLPGYTCFPILDANAPPLDGLIAALRDVESRDAQRIYIHCAQGHGRTAMFTAALLLLRGDAIDVSAAVDAVRKVRPLAEMNQRQRQFLEVLALRLQQLQR